jgi:hypothetical protein
LPVAIATKKRRVSEEKISFRAVESIQASAQSHLEAAEPGTWKAIRIAVPGKYFLGFARR